MGDSNNEFRICFEIWPNGYDTDSAGYLSLFLGNVSHIGHITGDSYTLFVIKSDGSRYTICTERNFCLNAGESLGEKKAIKLPELKHFFENKALTFACEIKLLGPKGDSDLQ